MKGKEIVEYIRINDPLKENDAVIEPDKYKEVYIVCEEPLANSYMEIREYVNNFNSNPNFPLYKAKYLVFNINSNFIRNLKKHNKEFFIVNKLFLLKIGVSPYVLNASNLLYNKNDINIYLYFKNKGQILKITKINQINHSINQNPINNIIKNNFN